jgi:hypothetical protein
MEILLALELIAGAIFVVFFGCKNLRQELARPNNRRPLNSYDKDERDHAARMHHSSTRRRSR